MEIAPGDRFVLVRKDDRIVGYGAGFDKERARGVFEKVEHCAHYLRLAAEAVGVLHLPAARMAGDDLAALKQAADGGGDANLARLASYVRKPLVEWLGASLE